MSQEISYYLNFIENLSLNAALNAKKMEELLYEDPSSSIIKARLFAEEVIKSVISIENIQSPHISSLHEKIIYLTNEGYLIPDIQLAFNTIRMIGNKAAHSSDFNDIEQAFKLHKVMYKIAIWFYETYSLEQIRIPSYEHPKPKKYELDNIEDLVKKQLKDMVSNGMIEHSLESHNKKEELNLSIIEKALPNGDSYLLRELRRLQDSSKEAIENANAFSNFKKYLHVDRKVQLDIERILNKNKDNSTSNLILLCGSVGDGKSHLLAYLKECRPELIRSYQIFNDATESFSPSKNAMETLTEILKDFSDEQLDSSSNKKVILAINMGVLHNFISAQHDITFEHFKGFITNSGLFSQNITTSYAEERFDLISFGDYQPYELTKAGANSNFYSNLLGKIFSTEAKNPFFVAYNEDLTHKVRTMAHENYEFMQSKYVQERIVQLIIQAIIKYKLVISARAFLNFIADILIPDDVENFSLLNDFERLDCSVATLLFKRKDRSPILKSLHELSPTHLRSAYIDQIVIDLNTLNDWKTIIDKYVSDKKGSQLLLPLVSQETLTHYPFIQFSEALIHLAYLTNDEFANKVDDSDYRRFIRRLYEFNSGDKKEIREFYEEVKVAIFKWRGYPLKDYIYINRSSENFRLAQKLNIKPMIDHLKFNQSDILDTFKSTISLSYHNGDAKNQIILDIDFSLYELLQMVREGYCPNKSDEEEAIKFVEFIEKLMGFGEKKNELLVHFPSDSRYYKLSRDDFGSFVFERESY